MSNHPPPYLSHLFQFCLHFINLIGLEAQGCKHQQEQQQDAHSQTGADTHGAPTPPTAPRPLLGRRRRPAGHETRRLVRIHRTSTSIHEEHLWEWIPVVAVHGAGRTERQTVCASIASAWRRCLSEHLCFKHPAWVINHPQSPPTTVKTSAHHFLWTLN